MPDSSAILQNNDHLTERKCLIRSATHQPGWTTKNQTNATVLHQAYLLQLKAARENNGYPAVSDLLLFHHDVSIQR